MKAKYYTHLGGSELIVGEVIVLFIYFISFQVVRKPYVLLYRQEGDPVSELFQKYNLSDLKLKTLVPLSYP